MYSDIGWPKFNCTLFKSVQRTNSTAHVKVDTWKENVIDKSPPLNKNIMQEKIVFNKT